MRCYICDAAISPEDVHLDSRFMGEKYGPVSPCVKCQIEIDEIFEPLSEEELDAQLSNEEDLLNDPELEEILQQSQSDSSRAASKA